MDAQERSRGPLPPAHATPLAIRRWVAALVAGLAATPTWGQEPSPATGPAPAAVPRRGGPLGRMARHVHSTLRDRFIGHPEEFVEPPHGFDLYENLGVMRAKADAHDFTLYRSDFLAGTSALSPGGARRLSLMAARLPGWLGPVVVEWIPDQPALAESRRAAVVAALQGASLPIVPERVVVGPSAYAGLMGVDAANNFDIMIIRDQSAPRSYSLTPVITITPGGGAR